MDYIFNYFSEYFDLFFLCAGLLLLLFVASNIEKRERGIVGAITILILVASLFEYLEIIMDESVFKREVFIRYLVYAISCILKPIIVVLFYHIKLKRHAKVESFLWIPCAINTIIYIISLFAYNNDNFHYIYWYTDGNMFERTWYLGYTVYVVVVLYLVSFIIFSAIQSKIQKENVEVNGIVILTVSTSLIAIFLSWYLKLRYTYVTDALIIGLLIYYIYLSYESAYKSATIHERQMQEKTTALMLSQIQPHFVYNTLATIQVLCDIDPELAGNTIADFSKYLRVNTDALNKKDPVPISDEINHAEAYSKIEMLRFENVEVKFDIKDTDFKLPVLTIQPMIENAIKYGVRAREHGLVEVKTYMDGEYHVLEIIDNGIGFDVSSVGNDGRNHVGIANVKTRVENMVNGTFEVESTIDVGTKIVIRVPEGRK